VTCISFSSDSLKLAVATSEGRIHVAIKCGDDMKWDITKTLRCDGARLRVYSSLQTFHRVSWQSLLGRRNALFSVLGALK
jgi:predicted component of type VI protein secretion system